MPPEENDTIAALIERRRDDDHVGLRSADRSWTWREVVSEMHARAAMLHDLLRDGDRPRHIGVLLDNVPEFLFLIGGCALSGSTLVGINPTRRGAELARDVTHTDCRAVFTSREYAPLLEGLDLGAANSRVIVCDEAGYEERVDAYRGVEFTPAHVRAGDLLFLIFTSGTSGAPKAVKMSHGRAHGVAVQMPWSPDDVLYCPMPLFHGNALNAILFPALATGATIALRARFSASAFLSDVREYGATFSSTVGRALAYILATPPAEGDRDNPLKVVLAPESSTPDIKAFGRRFGCYVISGYGSSENAVVMKPNPGLPEDALGEPIDGIDAAIVDPETGEERPRARFDEHGKLLNAEEAIGEIVGRQALGRFEGYYKNDEATAARTRNGWYWSGDLGYRDEAGVFYFAGRSADWIRVDAENFAAAPVERIIERFPGVQGVAVFGVPDERTADDQVMAVLELEDPASFDGRAFDEFLAAQTDLGTKWAPRYVRLTTQMPVGATQKTDKTRLRAERWGTDDLMWWRSERKDPLTPMTAGDVAVLEQRFTEHGRAGVLAR